MLALWSPEKYMQASLIDKVAVLSVATGAILTKNALALLSAGHVRTLV